jgi:hypothetical protein
MKKIQSNDKYEIKYSKSQIPENKDYENENP